MKKIISILLIFSFLYIPLFSADNNDNITEEEMPLWLQDFRRAEIVTLGSLPFTTMVVRMGYGVYNGCTTQDFSKMNPLKSANYTQEEITGILITSVSISLAVGLTDIIVNIIKRNKEKKIQDKYQLPDDLEIDINERVLPEIKSENPYLENTTIKLDESNSNSQDFNLETSAITEENLQQSEGVN